MRRRDQRETIFKLLFMMQFNSEEEMPEQMRIYFDSLKEGREELSYFMEEPTEDDETYIQEKFRKIQEKLPQIDKLLNETSEGWKTSRMGKVDVTILRLAVYEILYDEDVPVGVAINEAVELAKRFGGDESPSFVNGILGKIVRKEEQKG